ncbi:MAG: hypothetical protein ABSB13_05910 [Candidatus Binatus sp.]|jgi:hypothetical protein|uniref:hypothetical protein n=1 Tax=Candidatus Binatus sp. TaxID=2811406 RepID=UPI003D0CC9DD
MCIKMRRTTLVVILGAASLLAAFHVKPAGAATGPLRLIASGPALSVARVVWAGDVAVVQ